MVINMSVRDVPVEVRDELARRAKAANQSLQQYMLDLIIAAARRPDVDRLWERISGRARLAGSEYSFEDVTSDVREFREQGRPE